MKNENETDHEKVNENENKIKIWKMKLKFDLYSPHEVSSPLNSECFGPVNIRIWKENHPILKNLNLN